MTPITRTVAMLFLLLLGSGKLANAQSGSVYFAGGTATDSASGSIDTLGAGATYQTPSMGGFFETVGGDFMIRRHLGVGGEYSFRQGRSAYAGLTYHPAFYDINAVYRPGSDAQRIVPEFQGGVGKIALSFYYTPQFCSTFPEGCVSTTGQVSSDSHLQLHFAGGLRFYVIKGFFVRPQVDVHWVDNFHEFGSPWVPAYSVALGYRFTKLRWWL